MIRHDWTRNLVRVGFALGLLALAAGPALADHDDESYGYFRAIDGSATLIQAGSGTRTPAEINQPVMAGDRILVPGSSRVEIVLPDRNILRLDGGTEITLEQLAASADRDDPNTVLRLHDGNILLTVIADSLGDQLPRVDTPNAAVYPQAYGTYRITSSQDTFTEVTVRRGKAEVVTDRGSEEVRADETGVVEGERDARIEVESAANYDSLERWASRLDDEARYASTNDDYLDDNLRYQAAPLARYGGWISVGGRSYWRPRVSVGWTPYSQGRWAYTPAGLTWVSYEPWGWVPYHYGSWDYLPSYGWVWQAGYRWAPAWVYWYWGPSYVGWCPTGYYTSYYRGSYNYFRHGVYGWAGGGWDHWNHWTFVRSDYFRGYRDGYRNGYWDGRHDGRWDNWNVGRYAVPVDELRRHGPLDRGIVTTDTRPLRPDTWDDPRHAIRVLTEAPGGRPRYNQAGGAPAAAGGELPDVTPFIERRRDLPSGVVRSIIADNDGNQAGGDQTGGARPRPGTRGDSNGAVGQGRGSGSEPGVQSGGRIRGGAPRPEAGGGVGGGAVESTPRVRVPRETTQGGSGGYGGSETRTRGSREGGAPRPESTQGDSPSSARERNGDRGGSSERGTSGERNTTSDRGARGGYARPEPPQSYSPPPSSSSRDRGREQQDSGARGGYSRPSYTPPPSSSTRERERDRDQGSSSRGGYTRPSRPEPPASYSPPPSSSRERERERYSPPPSSSRPEASPSPSYRERESSRPSEDRGSSRRGGESRGSSGSSGSSSRSRERRPPQ
ncbi:MAG TPA: DUF6600 domain-containing protein [Thermoanaerobaculia bacterium]|nr:DUF6600 domain-containing protein [Thermoanaerobaculia bacterium]